MLHFKIESAQHLGDSTRTLVLEKLMAIEVPTPPLAVQQRFDRLQAKVAALKARHATLCAASAALIAATLERVFARGAAA